MIKDLRPALRAYLLSYPQIFTRVGGNRVFPSVIPQSIRSDCLVYHRVSGMGDHHMQGPSGLATVRMQLTAWSLALDGAVELANLVKFHLDGFRGLMDSGGSPPDAFAVRVQGACYDGDNPPIQDMARAMFGVGRDYMIVYAER